MSEYQYIAFRAVDRALTDRELAFAEKQSTRAEITRRSFDNEYHYGDFHGDADGLLRHGYDVHLHYANFGVRKISLRLPSGFPFPKSVWLQYLGDGEIEWKKDAKGKGGILTIAPYHDGGEIDEIWSPDEYVDDVVAIRSLLVSGDLRALYVLWLCAAYDDCVDPQELIEPPVPGGLVELGDFASDLLVFFGLDPLILVAAAEGSPIASTEQSREEQIAHWVDGLGEAEVKRHLRELLAKDAAQVKADLMASIGKSKDSSGWPTAALERSVGDLLERTDSLRAEHKAKERAKQEARARREAAKREKARQERMKEMVKEPKKWLRKAEKLVEGRGTQNYEEAAEILADLREAVGGEEGERVTHKHAAHLTVKHPTLNRLKSSLQKRKLL